MQLDLAVLQLCNDCVVVKVLGGMVELPDKRVPLLVLCGIVELQLVSKELRLQWRLQRRRERDREGEGDEEGRDRGERSTYTHVIYVLSSYQTLCVHFTSHEHNTCKIKRI